MFQLLYVSKETAPMSDEDCESLLNTARRNNNRNNITGFLAYLPNGVIIQILEGEQDVVLQTFERISKDPRHTNTSIVFESEGDERQFFDWSMGFRKFSNSEAEKVPGFVDLRDDKALASLGDGPSVIMLLKSIFVANEAGT